MKANLFASQRLASTLLLSLLAACGGSGGGSGSSGGSSSSNASTPSSSPAIALVPSTSATIAAYAETGNPIADSFGYLNMIRETMGLRVLAQDANVATASQHHANYLVANDAQGHDEVAGQPGFTGVDPQTRIAALHPTAYTGEVTITVQSNQLPDSLYGIETLFNAPFHRIVMLSDFALAGVGYDTSDQAGAANLYSALNVDFADSANSLASNQLVAYPYSGQTGAPYQWIASESPNPMNDVPSYIGNTVGYPVTIQGATGDALVISSFRIASNGADVPCQEVDPQTASIGGDLHDAAMCTPLQPLTPNTPYTATVAGTKNGQAFNVSWNWTTATAAAVQKQAVGGAQGMKVTIE